MELYTVVEPNDNAVKAIGGIYIEKKEYSNKELKKYLEIAKHYYIHIYTETESTDFNDRYSDSWSKDIPCNYLNLVIKEDQLYGFIAYGLERLREIVILTFEKDSLRLFDGSDYSSIDREFTLKKYAFDEAVLDIPMKYKVTRTQTSYKVKNDELVEPPLEGRATYNLTCFDVVVSDGMPVGIKVGEVSFDLNNPETFVQEVISDDILGVQKYHNIYKYELVEII